MLLLLLPLLLLSQNFDVECVLIADTRSNTPSIRLHETDILDQQDFEVNEMIDIDLLNVQHRLNEGETPIQIYQSNNSLLDSLYGKAYQGGLLAFLNIKTGHGLIAATSDLTNAGVWGCYAEDIEQTSSKMEMGSSNTMQIIHNCSEVGIAARLCDEYEDGAYNDWFLPSIYELNKLYYNLHKNGFGNFRSLYWSSTEEDYKNAWIQDFVDSTKNHISKANELHVRAVRAF